MEKGGFGNGVGREGRARNRDLGNRRRQLTFCHEHDRYLIWWPLSSSIWFLTIACSSSLEMLEPASDTFFASLFTSYSESAIVSARGESWDVRVGRRVRLESQPGRVGGRRTSQGRSPVARRGWWSESWGAAPKTTRIVGAHWSLIKTMSKGAMACDYLIYCAKRDSVCTGKSSPTLWWSAV